MGTQHIVGQKMSTKSWTAVIFISFTRILVLFGTKFQYSHKRRQDEEGKQPGNKAAIWELVLTFATAYTENWNSWCLYNYASISLTQELIFFKQFFNRALKAICGTFMAIVLKSKLKCFQLLKMWKLFKQ